MLYLAPRFRGPQSRNGAIGVPTGGFFSYSVPLCLCPFAPCFYLHFQRPQAHVLGGLLMPLSIALAAFRSTLYASRSQDSLCIFLYLLCAFVPLSLSFTFSRSPPTADNSADSYSSGLLLHVVFAHPYRLTNHKILHRLSSYVQCSP